MNMKYRILFLLLVISCAAAAQTPPGYTNISARYDWLAGKFRTGLHIPAFCGFPVTNTGIWAGDGQIAVDTCNNKFYVYSGGSWRNLADSTTLATSGWGLSGNSLTGNPFLGSTNSRSVKFRVNNSEVMRLDSVAGFVGINTTTPVYTLDVAGSLGVTTVPFTAASNDTTVYWNPSTRQMERRLNTGGGGGSSVVFDSLHLFNVVQYGADSTGASSSQAAIDNAALAAAANGGGTVYFPKGVYLIDSLTIPFVAYSNSGNLIKIHYYGESGPNIYSDPLTAVANRPFPTSGVVLKSTKSDGGSVIRSSGAITSWQAMNHVFPMLENLTIRLKSRDGSNLNIAPKAKAINVSNVAYFHGKNLRIDTEGPADSLLSPEGTSAGIILPYSGNFVMSKLENVFITGVDSGVVMYEHADLDNIFIDVCKRAFVMPGTDHSMHINKAVVARCAYTFTVYGSSTQSIKADDVSVERQPAPGKWYDFVSDLDEQTPGQAAGHLWIHPVHGATRFVRTNYIGSRIQSATSFSNGFHWPSDAAIPLNADTAMFGFNTTNYHLQYYMGSTQGWKTAPHIGQTDNFYTTSTSKWAIGGNPNGDTYRLNISDSAGLGPNMIRMHTTGNPIVFMNSTGGSAQLSYQFAKSGTVQYQWGMNFNSDATPDFYVYDQVNALAKIYSPNSTSDLFLGANAFTGTGLTILNAGRVGIATTAPTARLHLPAGAAAANGAPLKFTSGTNLTSVEAGSVEYNGASFFFNPSTTRLRAVLTDNSIPSNGQLPIGNGTNYTNATITAGTGISVTNGAGSITIASTSGFTPASVSTSDATVTTIATIATSSNEFGVIEVTLVGHRTTSDGHGITGKKIVRYRNIAGTITVGSITSLLTDELTGLTTATWTITSSGSNILIRVTGEAATNIDWSIKYVSTIQVFNP